MDAIVISAETVRDGLTRAVAERGEDFVYEKADPEGVCTYVRDGRPDCMIGQFLADQGVPVERLALFDPKGGPGWGSGAGAIEVIRTLEGEGVITVEGAWAPHALATAQSLQDEGLSWGYALEAALETLEQEN